jgi:cell division protein ZapA
MGQVSVTINGRDYDIACADGEEDHVSDLAAQVSARVDQLADNVGQLGEARMLLMACLVLADELKEGNSGSSAAAGGNAAELLDAASERIELIAQRLEKA